MRKDIIAVLPLIAWPIVALAIVVITKPWIETAAVALWRVSH